MTEPRWHLPPGLSTQKRFLDAPRDFGQFWLLRRLGHGAFGEVFCAVRKRDVPVSDAATCEQLYRATARKWAVKLFDEKKADAFKDERKIALSISRKTTAPSILAYDTEHDGAMSFEFCNAGTLQEFVELCAQRKRKRERELSVADIVTLMLPLCDALEELVRIKIVHCDIALRNVFLHVDERTLKLRVKLGDFGLCKDLGDSKFETFHDLYSAHSAPEIDGKTKYDYRADLYSLGVLLYELLTLQVVHVSTRAQKFDAQAISNARDTMDAAIRGSRSSSHRHPLFELAQRLTRRSPGDRPAIDNVRQCLIGLQKVGPDSRAIVQLLLAHRNPAQSAIFFPLAPVATSRVRIIALDCFGQQQRCGGDSVVAQTLSGVPLHAVDNGDGSYDVRCSAALARSGAIQVSCNNKQAAPLATVPTPPVRSWLLAFVVLIAAWLGSLWWMHRAMQPADSLRGLQELHAQLAEQSVLLRKADVRGLELNRQLDLLSKDAEHSAELMSELQTRLANCSSASLLSAEAHRTELAALVSNHSVVVAANKAEIQLLRQKEANSTNRILRCKQRVSSDKEESARLSELLIDLQDRLDNSTLRTSALAAELSSCNEAANRTAFAILAVRAKFDELLNLPDNGLRSLESQLVATSSALSVARAQKDLLQTQLADCAGRSRGGGPSTTAMPAVQPVAGSFQRLLLDPLVAVLRFVVSVPWTAFQFVASLLEFLVSALQFLFHPTFIRILIFTTLSKALLRAFSSKM